jgi:nitrate/nitrite transporter NarK
MPIVDNATPAQQSRALWLSTVAFTTCFAVWSIFSIIGLQIQKDLGLSETEFGLLVGTPILSVSLIRLILSVWSDQYGGRIVYAIVMVTAAIATFLLTTVDTYLMYLVAALGIGIAGGAFAVGIAFTSRWFPAEAKIFGPDRIIGFSLIPAMSMVSYAAGSRYLSLIGGVSMSFYDWYCDLAPPGTGFATPSRTF